MNAEKEHFELQVRLHKSDSTPSAADRKKIAELWGKMTAPQKRRYEVSLQKRSTLQKAVTQAEARVATALQEFQVNPSERTKLNLKSAHSHWGAIRATEDIRRVEYPTPYDR